MVGIIDYGAGNLKSVLNVFEYLGESCVVVDSKQKLKDSSALVLPGVGAFPHAVVHLEESGLLGTILSNIESGKFILGICLGLQLFCSKSFEDAETDGLSIFQNQVIPFEKGSLKIPHMGWNNLIFDKHDDILDGINEGEGVYFVHSFYADTVDRSNLISHVEYGVDVPAILRKDNVIGMQFHPEKSGEVGMRFLKNYLNIAK